ncbi:MAG: hypothetical protein ACYTG4_13260 [Planctomycetota bacterium]
MKYKGVLREDRESTVPRKGKTVATMTLFDGRGLGGDLDFGDLDDDGELLFTSILEGYRFGRDLFLFSDPGYDYYSGGREVDAEWSDLSIHLRGKSDKRGTKLKFSGSMVGQEGLIDVSLRVKWVGDSEPPKGDSSAR